MWFRSKCYSWRNGNVSNCIKDHVKNPFKLKIGLKIFINPKYKIYKTSSNSKHMHYSIKCILDLIRSIMMPDESDADDDEIRIDAFFLSICNTNKLFFFCSSHWRFCYLLLWVVWVRVMYTLLMVFVWKVATYVIHFFLLWTNTHHQHDYYFCYDPIL